jgi:hypothetical protein
LTASDFIHYNIVCTPKTVRIVRHTQVFDPTAAISVHFFTDRPRRDDMTTVEPKKSVLDEAGADLIAVFAIEIKRSTFSGG